MYFKFYDTGNNLGKLIGKFCMYLILQILQRQIATFFKTN